MSGSFSVGGLQSGLDTDAIIEALVNVKTEQLITPLENRVLELQDYQTALDAVGDDMNSMLGAASLLRNITSYEGRSSDTSDSTTVSINSTSSTAAKGTYAITISQLAQSSKKYFTGVVNSNLQQFGTGLITITSSGVTKTVDITSSNNTLEGIRDAINNTSGMPITASIVNDGSGATPYRLVLTATSTGLASEITNDISTVLTLTNDAGLNANAANLARDANLNINGLALVKSSNTITDGIPGLSISLLQTETVDPIRITVDADYTAVSSAINNFVTAYNNVIEQFQEQFARDTTTFQSTGVLAGDFALQTSQNRLHNIVLGVYNSLAGNDYQTFSSIGLSMDEYGLLSLDTNELEAALGSDNNAVRTLFQGTTTANGIADDAYNYLYSLTNSADGLFTQKNQIWQENIQDLLDQIDERNLRIDAYEAMMRQKFIDMEEALTLLEGQSSALDALQSSLDSISGSGN